MPNPVYIPPFPWDLDALPFVSLEDQDTLPTCPGVYFVRTDTAVLYVGATNNLFRRVKFHNKLAEFQAWPVSIMIAWVPILTKKPTWLRTYEYQALAYYKPQMNRYIPSQQHMEASVFHTLDDLLGIEAHAAQETTT